MIACVFFSLLGCETICSVVKVVKSEKEQENASCIHVKGRKLSRQASKYYDYDAQAWLVEEAITIFQFIYEPYRTSSHPF